MLGRPQRVEAQLGQQTGLRGELAMERGQVRGTRGRGLERPQADAEIGYARQSETAVAPPSTGWTAPVIHLASSEARNNARFATSSTAPMWPSGKSRARSARSAA